jgi:hypothetical protein
MIYKKGENIPEEWYEITQGRDKSPLLLLRFYQDCEELVINGIRHIRPLSGYGCTFEVHNATDIHINFILPVKAHIHLEQDLQPKIPAMMNGLQLDIKTAGAYFE